MSAGDKRMLSELRHKQGLKDMAEGKEIQQRGESGQFPAEIKGVGRSQEKEEKRGKRKESEGGRE